MEVGKIPYSQYGYNSASEETSQLRNFEIIKGKVTSLCVIESKIYSPYELASKDKMSSEIISQLFV